MNYIKKTGINLTNHLFRNIMRMITHKKLNIMKVKEDQMNVSKLENLMEVSKVISINLEEIKGNHILVILFIMTGTINISINLITN